MEAEDPLAALYDGAIVEHGFTRYIRDYAITVQLWGLDERPPPWRRYVFTHCVLAETLTVLTDETWAASWNSPTDLAEWSEAGAAGFAWGVRWANVEHAAYMEDSPDAAEWTRRLGHVMREARIETQVYVVRLIFHELRVEPLPIRSN